MGVPALAGWLAGDVAAGLLATTGGFTSLYGSGRPYVNRAIHLAVVAVAIAVGVFLGSWVSSTAWLAVVVVALIAVVATLVCNALAVGPPGAYMFALTCAAGTAIPATHLNHWHIFLLVLSGGAFSWLVHMAGVLFWPRGPEKSAVAAAGDAVARFIESVGTPQQDTARHWAALAMRESWAALVTYQPSNPRPNSTLHRLRGLARELHLLFAEAMSAAAKQEPPDPAAADRARRLAAQAQDPPDTVGVASEYDIPLGRPRPAESLREAIRPGSMSMLVVARVGIAALIAGFIAAELGLEHSYWAIAAAVLMLHQGFDWIRTWQKSLERTAGTWIGLVIAAVILSAHPRGLWLVATIMVLQFTIEMFVVRSYAIAVVFITPAGLTIATGGQDVADVGELLIARGIDTVIGCAVALAVYLLTMPRRVETRIPAAIVDTLDAVDRTVLHLSLGQVTTAQARASRRDLQHHVLALAPAYEAGVGASARQRKTAEEMWPAVAATQGLAYRTLSTCWAMERIGGDAARAAAMSLFGPDGETHVHAVLEDLAASVHDGRNPAPVPELPSFLYTELGTLQESLVREPTRR